MNKYLKRLQQNLDRDPDGKFGLLDHFTGMHPRHTGSIRAEPYYDEVRCDKLGEVPNRTYVKKRIEGFCPHYNNLVESGSLDYIPKHVVV